MCSNLHPVPPSVACVPFCSGSSLKSKVGYQHRNLLPLTIEPQPPCLSYPVLGLIKSTKKYVLYLYYNLKIIVCSSFFVYMLVE